jgi:hypothetical protein
MTTWDEVVSRDVACGHCRRAFRVHGPLSDSERVEIRRLLEAARPVSAIQFIREATAGDLFDAKAMFEHVTIQRGVCHECGTALHESPITDCRTCERSTSTSSTRPVTHSGAPATPTGDIVETELAPSVVGA